MRLDDLRGMRGGMPLVSLTQSDAALLSAIDYRTEKTDRVLLLLHGFSSTPAVFRAMLPSLSYYDAVIAPVLPGHADSIEAFSKASASDWFKVAQEICASLVKDYRQVDVLGFSLGGLLAFDVANRFHLNHLYLLAPAFDLPLTLLDLPNLLKLVQGLYKLGFSAIRSYGGDLYTSTHYEIDYRTIHLHAIMEMLTLIKTFPFALPTCPIDVFLGCHDKVVSSQKVAERFMNQPDVAVHWLEQSAHVIPLDGDIESVIDRMKL